MTLTENDYGYEKSICGALLFRKDMTKASAKHSQSGVDWNIVNNMQYRIYEIETPHIMFFAFKMQAFTVQQKNSSHVEGKRLCILR